MREKHVIRKSQYNQTVYQEITILNNLLLSTLKIQDEEI